MYMYNIIGIGTSSFVLYREVYFIWRLKIWVVLRGVLYLE